MDLHWSRILNMSLVIACHESLLQSDWSATRAIKDIQTSNLQWLGKDSNGPFIRWKDINIFLEMTNASQSHNGSCLQLSSQMTSSQSNVQASGSDTTQKRLKASETNDVPTSYWFQVSRFSSHLQFSSLLLALIKVHMPHHRLLLPQTFVACCQAQMLSKGGRCKTFDDSASGYARGAARCHGIDTPWYAFGKIEMMKSYRNGYK